MSLIQGERLQLAALQASVSITTTSGSSQGFPDLIRQSVAVDGDGHRRLSTELTHPGSPPKVWSVINAEDGVESLVAHPSFASAAVSAVPGAIGGAPIAWRAELLWFMRWLPAGGAAADNHPCDLLELLGRDSTQVLASLEEIDGVACVVVESHFPNGSVDERLWLDPTHGWLPRLQRAYGQSTSVVEVERRVQSFIGEAGGGFVPELGTLDCKADAGGLLPVDSTQVLTLVDNESWCWPTERGTASMAQFQSVRDLVPGGWTLVESQVTGALTLTHAGTPGDAATPAREPARLHAGVGWPARHVGLWLGLGACVAGGAGLSAASLRRRRGGTVTEATTDGVA
jgi:hypothetical protein